VRKLWLFLIVGLELLSANSKSVYIYDVYHPASEPNGLYIVTFDTYYDKFTQKYRVYCPTGMVREITGGKWRKARKAYKEDRLKYRSNYVVRRVFDAVCR